MPINDYSSRGSSPKDRKARASLDLSVVMPCYNEADHIEECVRAWTEMLSEVDGARNHEIIVVNDGSMDGTGRILDRLRKEMPALRVIHQLNLGHEKAVERGYDLARGTYILQTESNGRFDPADFAAFWERRESFGLLLARRAKPVEGFSSRLYYRTVRSLVSLLFGSPWQEPHAPFRLFSRGCLLTQLERLPRGFGQVNLGLAILAHSDNPHGVTELEVPFRYRNGLRRRHSLFFWVGKFFNTLMELGRLRLSILRLRIHSTSTAEA